MCRGSMCSGGTHNTDSLRARACVSLRANVNVFDLRRGTCVDDKPMSSVGIKHTS